MSNRIALCFLFLGLPAAVFASDPSQALADRRQEFRQVLEQIERGAAIALTEVRKQQDHPLFPYLEYAQLRRQLASAKPAEIERFLDRHVNLPISERLRGEWLGVLGKRQAWADYRRVYRQSQNETLRCYAANAWLQVKATRTQGLKLAESLWLSGRSVSDACNPAFAQLAVAGKITPALRWQRVELALRANNPGIARFAARGLPAAEQKQALALADWLEQPSKGPGTGLPAEAAAAVLVNIAKRDPDLAESQLAALDKALRFSADQRGAVLNAIALWSAADPRLREWQAREALARQDYAAVEQALKKMSAEQGQDSRWRYLAARIDELQGRTDSANEQFRQLAEEANFHGFLAADRINAEYALCPLDAPDNSKLKQQIFDVAGMQRAFELFQLGRRGWAAAEWSAAVPALSDDERRVAVELAIEAGWTDRAVFGIDPSKDSQFYRLRFPIAYTRELNRESKRHQLDSAWVAGLIRAESAWQHDARSHADARGLMQLLPSTAAPLAKQLGLRWRPSSTLYDPISNIRLGTAHLARELARLNGRPFLATAAYNAGPTPVGRWMQQRATDPIDLWIETIPYKETREYVARVMAFAVIYDWRLGREPLALSARLQGDSTKAQRRRFHCPSSTAALAQQP